MKTNLLCLFLTACFYNFSFASIHLTQSDQDTSRVRILLDKYESLKYDNQVEAENQVRKALALAKSLAYDQGIVDSQLAIGAMLEMQSSYDSALIYFEQAYKEAKQFGYKKGLIRSLIGQGKTYRSISEWDKAIPPLKQALEILQLGEGDSSMLATCYNHLGNIYSDQHQFEEALNYYQKCIELLDDNDRTKAIATLNIGLIHFRLQNFEQALEYYDRSLQVAEQMEERLIIAHCYHKMGMVKRNQEDYEDARRYYGLAIDQFKLINDRSMVALLYSNIGNIHFDHQQYRRAIDQYELSLAIQEEINDQVSQCYTLIGLGVAYGYLDEKQKAEAYLLRARNLSSTIGVDLIQRDAAMRLSEFYANNNNFRKAYDFQVELKQLDDSIFNETKANQIAELEAKFQNEQKSKEINLLNAENRITQLELEKQTNFRNYLIIVALIILILAIAIYKQSQTRARANKKLKELDQLKSQFFTNISHEFRTPLTLIKSPLEQMLSEKGDSEGKDKLELAHRNTLKLLGLINEILDLSKLDAGKLKLQVSKGDINQFASNVIASFGSYADQRKVKFEYHLDSNSKPVPFDAQTLHKVYTNLLSNAFKFTPEGGQVRVHTEMDNEYFRFSVSDTGSGIPAESLSSIFKRFHQLESNKKQGSEGSGIGLALVKELTELHHGSIDVESTMGKGSTFTVTIPVSERIYHGIETIPSGLAPDDISTESADTGKENSVRHAIEEDGSKPIVLVVEDHAELRAHIGDTLRDDYQVIEAIDGEDGLNKAVEAIPDLIITDLMMPNKDGIELSKGVRADVRTDHIPMILLTARADQDSKLEGLRTGVDDYLTKPFETEELKIRVQNLIAQRNRLRERFSSTIKLAPANVSIVPPDEVFIKKAMAIVEENMANVDFTVEQFQREIGMSRMQLHRKLKALTNHSTSGFIRMLRLQHAAELLTVNGIQVAEAAYRSGFSSLSYFTQCFKEKFGVNPSKYHENIA